MDLVFALQSMLYATNVEVTRKPCYRFEAISFFPRYRLEDILQLQFDLLWYAKQPINDYMDFAELLYFYDLLKTRIQEQNENGSGFDGLLPGH